MRLPESPDAYVLADAEIRDEVRRWIEQHRVNIIETARADAIRQAQQES